MRYTEKKKYISPLITEILIDRVIVLQTTSYIPPGDPYDTAPASSGSGEDGTSTIERQPTQKSGFEENPFER